jgi:hypothetical protein
VPPLRVRVLDPRGEGRGTFVRVSLERTVPPAAVQGIESLRISWVDSLGDGAEYRDVAWSALSTETDSLWSAFLTSPFALGQTGCAHSCLAEVRGVAGDTARPALLDSVPNSVVRARLRYAFDGSGRDTLLLDLSEPALAPGADDLLSSFARTGSLRKYQEVLPMISWSLQDGDRLVLVVPPTVSEAILPGDSARLSGFAEGARVLDRAGNPVGILSRWVPVEFGLRPPLFSVAPYRGVLDLSTTGPNGGAVPRVGAPQIELLQKLPDGSWVKADGSGSGRAGDGPITPVAQGLGIDIRINRPLEGVMIVYDNLGTAVGSIDLGTLTALWTEQPDVDRTIRVQWNGTAQDGRPVASGVYLFRLVARFRDSDGREGIHNEVWTLGLKRETP